MKICMLHGNSNPKLAEMVASYMEQKITPATVGNFKNSETHVIIHESVRECDTFILQSGCGAVNDMCMELFILINACRTASARRVVAVLPYFPYSKQSKQKKRGTIPARLVASMLKVAGVDQVLTMDLHHMQMQGFFEVPVDNLRASPLLMRYIRDNVPGYRDAVIVAKNAGASKRAAIVAKRLRLGFAIIFGEQTKYAENLSEERLGGESQLEAESELASGGTFASFTSSLGMATGGGNGNGNGSGSGSKSKSNSSEGGGGSSSSMADGTNKSPPRRSPSDQRLAELALEEADDFAQGDGIIGDVVGKMVIMVDDLIDSADPFVAAAETLRSAGCKDVILLATHGVLAGSAPEDFAECESITRVVVTNTIPQEDHRARCPKLDVIDCSPVLGEACRRIHNNESMVALYSSHFGEDLAKEPPKPTKAPGSPLRSSKRGSSADQHENPSSPLRSATC